MNLRTVVAAICAVVCLSCASAPIHGSVPQGQRPRAMVKLWIEDVPEMPAHLILEGCDVWSVLGIGCEMVSDKAMADVRFEAIRKPCLPDLPPPKGDGKKTLATAHSDRHIEMYVNCFRGSDGRIAEDKMRSVAAHELGHELGIWDHVPLKCDDPDIKYQLLANDAKLCGEAMMNPDYDDDVLELTDMDGHAFDHRNRDYSVYRETNGINNMPLPDVICTYGDRHDDTN